MDLTLGIYRIFSKSDPWAPFSPPSRSITHHCLSCLVLLLVSAWGHLPLVGGSRPQALEMEQRELSHPSTAKAENCLMFCILVENQQMYGTKG